MAAFSRGPDDITARLSDVIEHLQSDAVQEQAEEQTLLLLKELNRLLTLSDDPVKGKGGRLVNHAAQTGTFCSEDDRPCLRVMVRELHSTTERY